jgi:hypothetical protein
MRHAVGIGLHGFSNVGEKGVALIGREPAVVLEDGAGDGDTRGLAAARQQRGGKLANLLLRLGAAEGTRQELAALLRNAAQQLLQERSVHVQSPISRPNLRRAKTVKLTLKYNNFATRAFPVTVSA